MESNNKRKIKDIFDFDDLSNSLKCIKINDNQNKKQKLLKEELEEKNILFYLNKIEYLEKKVLKLENNLNILNNILQNKKNELSYIS